MGLRLFLIRHAQTVWNRDRRYQGWQDSPLSEIGRAPGRGGRPRPRQEPLKAVYASTLGRARETAEAIAATTASPCARRTTSARWPSASGRAWPSTTARPRTPTATASGRIEPHRFCPPGGGETLDDVRRRVLAGLERLRAEHDDQSVCLVAHGISARIIILEALGLPLERIWSIHLASTGISELEFRADWAALHRMNTLVHLDAVPAAR